MDFLFFDDCAHGPCRVDFRRMTDRRFWFVTPCGDHALLFPSVIAVMDDFGDLVKVLA